VFTGAVTLLFQLVVSLEMVWVGLNFQPYQQYAQATDFMRM